MCAILRTWWREVSERRNLGGKRRQRLERQLASILLTRKKRKCKIEGNFDLAQQKHCLAFSTMRWGNIGFGRRTGMKEDPQEKTGSEEICEDNTHGGAISILMYYNVRQQRNFDNLETWGNGMVP